LVQREASQLKATFAKMPFPEATALYFQQILAFSKWERSTQKTFLHSMKQAGSPKSLSGSTSGADVCAYCSDLMVQGRRIQQYQLPGDACLTIHVSLDENNLVTQAYFVSDR
jgi:hypothetical protein